MKPLPPLPTAAEMAIVRALYKAHLERKAERVAIAMRQDGVRP